MITNRKSTFVTKIWILLNIYKRHIQKPVKHLRWSFLKKWLTAFSFQPLIIFVKRVIFDVWQYSEYTSVYCPTLVAFNDQESPTPFTIFCRSCLVFRLFGWTLVTSSSQMHNTWVFNAAKVDKRPYIYDVHMEEDWWGLEICQAFADSIVFKQ